MREAARFVSLPKTVMIISNRLKYGLKYPEYTKDEDFNRLVNVYSSVDLPGSRRLSGTLDATPVYMQSPGPTKF